MKLIASLVAAAALMVSTTGYAQEALPADQVPEGNAYQQPADDGYKFTTPEYFWNTGTWKVVLYPNNSALQAAYKEISRGEKLPMKAKAFSILSADDKVCTIHMVTPDKTYDPTSLGHEFAHCLFGNFHIGG